MDLDIELLKARYPSAWKERAMDAVWREYYRRLAAFVRGSFGLKGDVDDVMQEVMMKVFTNLERYDRRFALSTWLYTIARNTALNWITRVSPGRGKVRERHLDFDPAVHGGVEAVYEAGEIDRIVEESLSEMTAEDRGMAFLVFYERAPYRDLCVIYGLEMHTVKNRIFKIRKELKRRLEDYRA